MPARFQAIAKSQFVCTIKGVDTHWETFSGVDEATQTSRYSDGLSNRLYPLMGPRSLADMVLTKAFDPIKDRAIVDFYRSYCQGQERDITMSVTPVKYCPDSEPIGAGVTLYGVQIVSFKGFEVDKKSNDPSMISLTVIAEDYTYQ